MIKIGPFQIKSPLILGANDMLLNSDDFNHVKNCTKHLGAFITKSFTLEPRDGNLDPIVSYIGNNILVSSGMRNPGAKKIFKDIEIYNASYSKNDPLLIPSIASDPDSKYPPEKELSMLSIGLSNCGSNMVELNLSCPNLNTQNIAAKGPEAVFRIISHIINEYEKNNIKDYCIIAKITGLDPNMFELARSAQRAGASAITIVPLLHATGFYSGVFDSNTTRIGTPLLGNKFGSIHGDGLGPVTWYLISALRDEIDIPIIASGGCVGGPNSTIEEKLDCLIQTMIAGATAVEAVSSFYPVNIPQNLKKIDELLNKYYLFLEKHQIINF